jgi:hypothetical protein
MVDELIHRIFCSRNAAHLAHWATGSYAEHQALGHFYDEVIDLCDKFVEAYMGASGKKISTFEIPALPKVKDIAKYLVEEMEWFHENRDEIAGEIPALENILDEIVGLYLSTVYKLRQLS